MADLDYEGFWKETLVQLRNDLGEEEFSGWFSELKYLHASENSITIGVPSSFHQERMNSRYNNAICTALQALSGKEIAFKTEIIEANEADAEISSPEPAQTSKKDAPAAEKAPKQKVKREHHSQMRDDYTFDRYVIGDNNKFAANAALAISENPGKAYNPFLIYGGVGLGKTHLMQAIGNHVHENTNKEVIYITAENFLNEFIENVNTPQERGKNPMKLFKNKYRYTDVLLIDDIQILTDKPAAQEELFHTFNALHDAKKQLVFTCDRPISELKKFSERLISRFGLGLIVDLQPPRYEERCAILISEAANMNITLSKEVVDLISNNISSNIRDLKAALTKLIAYSRLMREEITLETAKQCLKTIFNEPKYTNLSMENIIKVVAEYFGLKSYDLTGKKRSQKIVNARQFAMYIGRNMTDYSTTEIGQDFGGRDHTTVMHSIKKIEGSLLTDPTIESTIDNLKRAVNEYSAKH